MRLIGHENAKCPAPVALRSRWPRPVDSDAKCNRRQHWFVNEKSGFPFGTPAFCSVSRGQRRLGEEEYRAPSVTPGVALPPRTQEVPRAGCSTPTLPAAPVTHPPPLLVANIYAFYVQGFLSFDNGLVRLIGSGGGARDAVRRETSRPRRDDASGRLQDKQPSGRDV
jgi:hypothetical protein